jgi:lipoprotein-anchoring transpeptidase ErfK/SrfK
MQPGLSRRDFLKASGAGLLGLFLANLRLERVFAAQTPKQGRIMDSGVELYTEPFFNANIIRLFGRDQVVEVTGEAQGDLGYGNPFNSTWYRVNNEGYVYSGRVQPVETRHQKPIFNISKEGVLGEITVPFCDTRRGISYYADRGYRIYYSTTHWITDTVVNRNEKSIWYEIYDRQTRESLYVPVHEMRVIPPDEFAPLSSNVPEEQKRIYVDLASQTVTAFEGENAAIVTRCASGAKGSETPLGEFRTYHKGPSVHMTNQGDGTENTYHLPGVPWVSFFTGSGVAFHGTYWHNDYGRPSSRGCVNLTPDDAKFIYRWTRPEVPIGTPYLNQPGEGTLVQVVLSNL